MSVREPSRALPRGERTAPAAACPGDVLALATSSDPWSPAVMVALAWAARWGSSLTGCFIEPALRTLREAETEPTVLGLLLDEPDADARQGAAFEALARQHGVAGAAWVVTHAGVVPTLRQLGAWHDLAVLERDMVEEAALFDILGEALLACRAPCLVLPPSWAREVSVERILIGWNGSIQATRAIHAALPFLALAREVVLLDGEPPAVPDAIDRAPRFDPLAYLQRHRIDAERRRPKRAPEHAGEALLDQAREMEAGLLVMGAYGHSRLRERVFGGATRHVLQHAHLPVLMQH